VKLLSKIALASLTLLILPKPLEFPAGATSLKALRSSLRAFPLVLALTLAFPLSSCTTKVKQEAYEAPWGDASDASDELIMLTLTGPDTYYEYHGRDMGANYLLCEKLAAHLGKTVRIDVCKDTLEMLERLSNDEGDVIAVPLSPKHQAGFISVANNWVVGEHSDSLARIIREWYKPQMLSEIKKQEQYQISVASVTRRVFPTMLSAAKGQISSYDHLFRQYAPVAMVDWVLFASQCYQESCFDPQARSWAGACGLMQIMPSTADHLSLPREQLYQPDANISAAARYMRELQVHFNDIPNPAERLRFALAAYNGGANHVRDAMALTKKYGGIPHRWSDVRRYILLLQDPRYYTDPVVSNGYMRGSETAQYVDNIMERYSRYRYALATGTVQGSKFKVQSSKLEPSTLNPPPSTLQLSTPHRAAKKNKWRKD